MVDTSEQKAVPVAQDILERLRRMISPDGRLTFAAADFENIGSVERETVKMAIDYFAALPCKSGEGADLAVWCAREAEARRAEGNSSPHTAKLTREGRYDDQGVMPVAIAAARIALALTPDATQTREAEGEHNCPACPIGPRDIGAVLHNLVGQLERGGSILDERSQRKLADARAALDRWKPVVDAHFAAVKP